MDVRRGERAGEAVGVVVVRVVVAVAVAVPAGGWGRGRCWDGVGDWLLLGQCANAFMNENRGSTITLSIDSRILIISSDN